jgi:RNA polymerase sigma-70 factor, ECF subfamily
MMSSILYLQKEFRRMSSASQWDIGLESVGIRQDKTAFAELFEHFAPLLKAFLMKGGNLGPETAEELVQETMIKVWRRAPSFSRDQASATTWIYTIARNTRIDWYRKQSRQDASNLRAEDIYDEVEGASPYASLLQVRSISTITDQLLELPTEQAAVLRLMYLEGMSGQQVADALALPLGTVKSRIRLALAKLKINLGKEQLSGGAQSD